MVPVEILAGELFLLCLCYIIGRDGLKDNLLIPLREAENVSEQSPDGVSELQLNSLLAAYLPVAGRARLNHWAKNIVSVTAILNLEMFRERVAYYGDASDRERILRWK